MSSQVKGTLVAAKVQSDSLLSIGTFPRKYVQGPGAVRKAASWFSEFGKKALMLGGERALGSIEGIVSAEFAGTRAELFKDPFRGESTEKEIERIRKLSQSVRADFLIAVGGGKAIDCIKAAAFLSKKPVIVIPTVASTDAPTSTVSVIYDERGDFTRYVLQSFNPDVVIVDTSVIAQAPFRYLAAGIGGAIGVSYEAPLAAAVRAVSVAGGRPLRSAVFIAERIREVLMQHSLAAKRSVERGIVTESLESTVEAVLLMSGIGFESGGLAVAHAIYHGYRDLNKPDAKLHGELVAFGTIVQLILMDNPRSEIEDVLSLCRSVDLPMTFDAIGITLDEVQRIAEVACEKGTAKNISFTITPDEVVGAMHLADEMGRGRL